MKTYFQLKEEYLDTIKNKIGKTVEIWKNPTKAEMKEVTEYSVKKPTGPYQAHGLITNYGKGDLYVWDDSAMHSEIVDGIVKFGAKNWITGYVQWMGRRFSISESNFWDIPSTNNGFKQWGVVDKSAPRDNPAVATRLSNDFLVVLNNMEANLNLKRLDLAVGMKQGEDTGWGRASGSLKADFYKEGSKWAWREYK